MAKTYYMPKLLSGSTAVNGEGLTNHGGYAHNGAECSIIQTDADTGVFGGASFWGDGSSWDAKSYQDLRDHPNGDLNLFLKCVCINGVPHYREIVQYDVNEVFSDE